MRVPRKGQGLAGRLAWTEAGNGPPALLIHGDFSHGRGAWSRQLEALSGEARLIAVDRRGFGRSPEGDGEPGIVSDAEDIASLLDVLGLRRVLVGAHSYGGLVGVEFAARYPDRVRGLLLVEPPYLSLIAENPDAADLAGRVAEIAAHGAVRTPEELAERFFRAVAGEDEFERLRASSAWPEIAYQGQRIDRAASVADFPAARLDDLDPPLLMRVFRGGRSHPALRAAAAEIARRRGAPLVTVPEAGHAVQLVGTAVTDGMREMLRQSGER